MSTIYVYISTIYVSMHNMQNKSIKHFFTLTLALALIPEL